MVSKLETLQFIDNEPHWKEQVILQPGQTAYIKSWLNKLEHYMLIQCSPDDTTTILAKTPASNIEHSKANPTELIIHDTNLVEHIRDLHMSETHIFNVQRDSKHPVNMIRLTHE